MAWVASERLDLLKAFFLGLTFTAIFYEVFPVPLIEPGRLLSVFDNAVSETIVALAAWALFTLALKNLRYRSDRRSLILLASPEARELLAKGASPASSLDLGAELARLLRKSRPSWSSEGMVVRRLSAVSRLLEPHAAVGLHRNLLAQSDIDARRLDASYTALRVLIWAIPILGFIGTVLGIGDAIVEFSRFVQGTDPANLLGPQMRAALTGVTGGLAIAFNTTFLALVFVIPVMLWGSLLQKAEEDLLLSLDEFCLWELAGRLKLSWDADVAGAGAQLVSNSAEVMGQLERAVAHFSRQADLTAHQLAGVQPLVKDFTDRLLETSDPAGPQSPVADPAAPKREAEVG